MRVRLFLLSRGERCSDAAFIAIRNRAVRTLRLQRHRAASADVSRDRAMGSAAAASYVTATNFRPPHAKKTDGRRTFYRRRIRNVARVLLARYWTVV